MGLSPDCTDLGKPAIMQFRALIAFGLVAKLAAAVLNTTLLPPSQDPWYTAPAGFEVTYQLGVSGAPGAVRFETVALREIGS